jgi:hypothetical protein
MHTTSAATSSGWYVSKKSSSAALYVNASSSADFGSFIAIRSISAMSRGWRPFSRSSAQRWTMVPRPAATLSPCELIDFNRS